MYRMVELLYYAPETNITLYVNYTSIQKVFSQKRSLIFLECLLQEQKLTGIDDRHGEFPIGGKGTPSPLVKEYLEEQVAELWGQSGYKF